MPTPKPARTICGAIRSAWASAGIAQCRRCPRRARDHPGALCTQPGPSPAHTRSPASVRVLEPGDEHITWLGARGATPVSCHWHAAVMVDLGSDNPIYVNFAAPPPL